MALTRVSPALFQVSNNITSVTVGGSANTISLTFDSNGVITGASNNAVSVANTAITGNIISSQITYVANTQLTGLIQAAQIGSANASLITSGTLPGARLPTGSVLQVVNATRNGGTVATTSASDVSFGATASITPTSNTSKIYVIASGAWYVASGGTATEYAIGIQRNGSTIPSANNDGLVSVYAIGEVADSYCITILDTPAATNATTYLVVAHRINPGTSTLSNGIRASQLNQITLMEIAA